MVVVVIVAVMVSAAALEMGVVFGC